jgi:hypothetical protein
MKRMIEQLSKHSEEINLWATTLLPEETDIFEPKTTIKNLRSKFGDRYDLNVPKIFYDKNIRYVNYTIIMPESYVALHNHENVSYILKGNPKNIYVPWEGGEDYKTTHFVLQTNDQAYYVFGNTRYKWIKNKFENLDALHTLHYANNPAKTPIRFLYIDYYEN